MESPDLDYAARFTDWAARQPTWKQRIQAQYRHWVAGNPNYGANDVSYKPADDVEMPGDLPYPSKTNPPKNPGNAHKTFSPDPWKDVRGTATPTGQSVGQSDSILLEAHGLVHGPRQASYGHPAQDFSRTAALANVLLAGKLSRDLDARDVAMFMVAVKLSRQVNKHGRDNLVDAAGYLETLRMVEDFFATVNGGLHEDQA